ncbi:hypothetical protein JGU71_24250 [Antrihabitans sp. YC3-6]|uniref:Mce-associated membrane protein n=1 Tax=Antrihabitans stalagmiti TaxID=2799499 RepID=A0A934NVF5_9NOCA|nr:hypothetical protein [Antrihabitans stalagmiti]MBJ8342004.1 hypothetical protein [Antrihabitans stalagmiti]
MTMTEEPTVTDSPVRAPKRTVSFSWSTLAWGAATAALVVAVVVLAVIAISSRRDIAQRDSAAADANRAEQVATDYAVGAATVRFDDFDAWVGRLKTNTAPALADKFAATAPKLQEILTPLKWTSTATPIAAKVISESGGTRQVDVFLDVNSTNAQNPDGAQTTVTYTITIDQDSDWQVTDVGGMDAALPTK